MPFCRDCGKEVQDDWKLCPYCESPVNPSTPESASQPTEVNVTDSVVMGNVENTTNITVIEEKNIHSHLLTMVDAFREGQTKKAIEIFETAKKINHSLANDLRNGEYRLQVNEARLAALTDQWETKLERKAPYYWDDKEKISPMEPVIDTAIKEAFSIIEEVPEMYKLYVILGGIGAEYRGLKITEHEGHNLAYWAANELRKIGKDGVANIVEELIQKREKRDAMRIRELAKMYDKEAKQEYTSFLAALISFFILITLLSLL
jgi:hypothetical protein